MIWFNRRILLVPVVLVAAGVAIAVTAALTSWWVLLALVPLAMMIGCAVMMAARPRMPGGPSAAGWGCCAVSSPSADAVDPERKETNAPPARWSCRPSL